MTTQPHTDVRTDLGRRGETLAARHLTSLGMQVLARNWRCPGGELDLVLRQGSTLIACEATNRAAYLMELDPRYCDVIVARWEKFTGKTAQRPEREIASGKPMQGRKAAV